MNHQRHLIREAIVTRLINANTAAGNRVFDHPLVPPGQQPALVVTDKKESQANASGAAGPLERRLVLTITAEVQLLSGYAAARDQLLADVEVALATASIPGIKSIRLLGYEPASDANRSVAMGRQEIEVLYFSPQGNPSITL